MKKYLVILIILLIVYNIFRYCIHTEFTNLIKKKEKFATIPNDSNTTRTITETSNDVNINNAINKLARIGKDLQNGASLKILSDLYIAPNAKFNLLPRGLILAWKFPVGTTLPPAGWAFCDGTNGTPNLRGRMILGDGQGKDTDGKLLTNRVFSATGAVGGLEKVPLAITQIPKHTHNINDKINETHPIVIAPARRAAPLPAGSYGFQNFPYVHNSKMTMFYNVSNGPISSTVGNTAHENMPPFYVLRYIMKL